MRLKEFAHGFDLGGKHAFGQLFLSPTGVAYRPASATHCNGAVTMDHHWTAATSSSVGAAKPIIGAGGDGGGRKMGGESLLLTNESDEDRHKRGAPPSHKHDEFHSAHIGVAKRPLAD